MHPPADGLQVGRVQHAQDHLERDQGQADDSISQPGSMDGLDIDDGDGG